MTDDRIRHIELYGLPPDGYLRRYMKELIREVRRARQSEKICRAAAMIYKQREPVKLRRIA